MRVEGRIVTGNFFDVLGARACTGRTFTEAEDKAGAPRVVVVEPRPLAAAVRRRPRRSWDARVEVDGTAMTVIGVMPREFRYPTGADLWTPLVPVIPEVVDKANVGWATLVGRLAPGPTLAQARAELDTITAERLRRRRPPPRPRRRRC